MLATKDEPDVLCLQELPLWSIGQLEAWSGMAMFAARTRYRLGPLGRRPTDLHHGKLRSLLTGQANAVLVARRHAVTDHRRLVLNDRGFVMREGRRLGLGLAVSVAWSVERRVCQALRISPLGGSPMVVLHLHATHLRDRRCAEAELRRAVRFGEELAADGETAGRRRRPQSHCCLARSLGADGGRFLARRARASITSSCVARRLRRQSWPEERRSVNGRVLSDHPPVELEARSER